MKKNGSLNYSVLIVGLIFALSAVGFNIAQKSDSEPRTSASKMSENQIKVREEIAKSVAGGLVLDTVAIKEPDWVLSKGAFMPKIEEPDPAGVVISFKKVEETIHINVFDFGTADRAENTFSMPRSMGTAVPIKIGDRGEKVYIDGRMTGLNFRIGNLKVGIGGTNDEKLAERFAGHVLEAIKGLASK